jgi:DNA-binding Lrp family transcriptional regulator
MLKQKDRLILSHLRKDARRTLTDISRRTYIPVTTIYDHIKRYEKRFIKKHTSIIDFKKLGYNSKTAIAIRVETGKDDVLKFLLGSASVNSAYRLNSDFDFLVEVVGKNDQFIDEFVKGLKQQYKIADTLVLPISDDLKQEEFLAESEQEPLNQL